MFLKYVGQTENFSYLGKDFSKGPIEIDDKTGAKWLKESPGCFVQVVPAKPAAAKPASAKPASAKPILAKPIQTKPAPAK